MTNNLSFVCKVNRDFATATIIHRFCVKKGSKVKPIKPSLNDHQHTYYNKRIELERKGIIQNNEFQQDYEFDSPSEASCIVQGSSCANFSNWRLCDEQSLHDIWDNPKRNQGKRKRTLGA